MFSDGPGSGSSEDNGVFSSGREADGVDHDPQDTQLFAGIVILASAIAGTRYRRIREVVVLKTLGATRPRIATTFSIEFAVLGLVAIGVRRK